MNKNISILLFLIFAVLVGFFSMKYLKPSVNIAKLPLYSTQYNLEFDAKSDLNFAITEAEKTNRRILMMVGGDWCSWCRALDKFLTQDNPEIEQSLHENFVVLKVYYGKGKYNHEFLSAYPRIIGTPHFFVLESDGNLLHSQDTSKLESARSYDALKMQAFLQHWKKPKK